MDAAALDAGRPGAREAVLNDSFSLIVRFLIGQLTAAEVDELIAFINVGSDPKTQSDRAEEWLCRRFPNVIVIDLTPADCLRRSRKAETN
jgi:hypothetical protein